MKFFAIFFFISLALAQLGAWTIAPGVTIYLHDVALVTLLIAFFFSKKQKRQPLPSIVWAVVSFAVIAQVSLLFNAHWLSTNQFLIGELYLIRWIAYAMLGWVVYRSQLTKEFWLAGLYLAGFAVAVVGLLQYILYPNLRNLMYLGWDPHQYRVFSTLLDPNFTGIILVLSLYIGIYLMGTKQKIVSFLGNVVIALALFLTYSRSSYVAFIIGSLLCGMMLGKRMRGIILAGIIAFVGILFFLPKPGGEGVNLLRTSTILARMDNYYYVLQHVPLAPFFGFGFNTLRYALGRDSMSHAGAGVDNSALFVLLTTGAVGLLSYLSMMYLVIRYAWKSMQQASEKHMGLLVFVSCMSIIVHAMFVNSLFYPFTMAWWWILAGILTARISRDAR